MNFKKYFSMLNASKYRFRIHFLLSLHITAFVYYILTDREMKGLFSEKSLHTLLKL